MSKEKVYKDPERELKRINTIRARKGPTWVRDNARKAAKLTPTKFNSQTASVAAKKRWEKVRAEKAQKGKA